MTTAEASYTKHTTHTDALDTLGTIITPNEGRDAIHVAVFPVQCADKWLTPGEDVAFLEDGRVTVARNVLAAGPAVGIVDPFLKHPVMEGQWLWLLVYPRQITSLRHVWEHPSFPSSKDPADAVLDSVLKEANEDSKAASERWLREWIADADCPDFHVTIGAMLQQAEGSDWDDDYVHFSGTDAHGEIPAEAWHHLGIYVGVDLSGDRPSHFSCSC